MVKRTIFITLAILIAGLAGPILMAAPKGTLVVATQAETFSMDPIDLVSAYQASYISLFYDQLVVDGEGQGFTPGLFKSWELVNKKTWRFHLQRGVTFHNGYPFTAADVEFIFQRIQAPSYKGPLRVYAKVIKKVHIIDDHTVDIKTKYPFSMLLSFMANVNVSSKKWVQENDKKTIKNVAMGTGPFKMVSWKKKQRVVAEANTAYFRGSPKVKRIIMKPIPEMSSRVAELMSGNAHVIVKVPPFIVPQLEKNPDTAVASNYSLRAMGMFINTLSVPELQDKRVRQALNYAVDKQAIIDGILQGYGKVIGVTAPVESRDVDRSIKPYPYDPKKARELLAEAGYPDGFELKVFSPSGRYAMDKEVVQAVAEQLSRVGIKTRVQIIETQQYFKRWVRKKLDGIMILGMGFGSNVMSGLALILDPRSVYNYYNNPDMAKLVKGYIVTMDPKKQLALSHKIQHLMHEDAAMLFLYNPVHMFGISKKVKGFKAYPSSSRMNLWKVSLAE